MHGIGHSSVCKSICRPDGDARVNLSYQMPVSVNDSVRNSKIWIMVDYIGRTGNGWRRGRSLPPSKRGKEGREREREREGERGREREIEREREGEGEREKELIERSLD